MGMHALKEKREWCLQAKRTRGLMLDAYFLRICVRMEGAVILRLAPGACFLSAQTQTDMFCSFVLPIGDALRDINYVLMLFVRDKILSMF
jgi:hypothetical protein